MYVKFFWITWHLVWGSWWPAEMYWTTRTWENGNATVKTWRHSTTIRYLLHVLWWVEHKTRDFGKHIEFRNRRIVRIVFKKQRLSFNMSAFHHRNIRRGPWQRPSTLRSPLGVSSFPYLRGFVLGDSSARSSVPKTSSEGRDWIFTMMLIMSAAARRRSVSSFSQSKLMT